MTQIDKENFSLIYDKLLAVFGVRFDHYKNQIQGDRQEIDFFL